MPLKWRPYSRFGKLVNFLAHIQLARHSDEAMLGAFLGDFLTPRSAAPLGATVVDEIVLHRRVDSYTDSHPLVKSTRRLCSPPNRLFARIALDVYYDHFLIKHWERYSEQTLDQVVDRFYAAIDRSSALLPAKVLRVTDRIVAQDWLRSYHSADGIQTAVEGISKRLSRKREHLIAAIVELRQNAALVEAGFKDFYPQLSQYTSKLREQTRADPV